MLFGIILPGFIIPAFDEEVFEDGGYSEDDIQNYKTQTFMMNLYLAITATIVLILVIFTFQDQPKALSKKELAELAKKKILASY